jgi:hypothetical protein
MPRERPKLLPMTNTENTQAPTTTFSPDSIEAPTVSTSSTTAAAAAAAAGLPSLPPGSALQALIGKRIKPLPPTTLETVTTTTTDKNQIIEEKKKDSPTSNTDLDEDTSDIKTPPMSPHSPVAPMPTILELKVPPAPSKPITSN